MKSKRIYTCPKCGYEEDRDINAAANIALTQEYEIISAQGFICTIKESSRAINEICNYKH